MKFGMRKPSVKRSFSAATKGRVTRTVKKSVNPLYGKKGMGALHPNKAIKNKAYKKVTFDPFKAFRR